MNRTGRSRSYTKKGPGRMPYAKTSKIARAAVRARRTPDGTLVLRSQVAPT